MQLETEQIKEATYNTKRPLTLAKGRFIYINMYLLTSS